MQGYYAGKKVIITGGAGFIGSNLAIRLVSLGAEVTVVDSLIPEYGGNLFNLEPIKDKIILNVSDVRDRYSFNHIIQGKDILFNMAGQTSHIDSMVNPFRDLEINALSQLSILEACRHSNPSITVVFASTRQVYGIPSYLPVDEEHPLRPVDVNGINKISGESYHLLYHNVYGIRTSVLRLTNTYGPRMRIKDAKQTFLGSWINKIINEAPLTIYGDGSQLRDFNYVDDVVDAFIQLGIDIRCYGKVFNLGALPPISLKSLADVILKMHGSGSVEYMPFPEDLKKIDIGNYYSDFSKIKNELEWTPKVSLVDGLRKTIDYFSNNLAKYVDTVLEN